MRSYGPGGIALLFSLILSVNTFNFILLALAIDFRFRHKFCATLVIEIMPKVINTINGLPFYVRIS